MTESDPILIGTIQLRSRELLVGDPAYIEDHGVRLELGDEPSARCFITVAEGRVATLQVVWSGDDVSELEEWGDIGEVPVDSGSVMVIGAQQLPRDFRDAPIQDIRLYTDGAGATLQYQRDFPNFAAPIASQDGRSMNDLLASGTWTELPYPGEFSLDHNGVFQARMQSEHGAAIVEHAAFITSSGWGDGVYGVYALANAEGEMAGISVVFIDTSAEEPDEEPATVEDTQPAATETP